MDRLQVERIGGFAGYGGPHLKARGEVALSSLSTADKKAVDDLFKNPDRPVHPGEADAFRYRITRQTSSGSQVIEVPEGAVPSAVKDTVRDTLE